MLENLNLHNVLILDIETVPQYSEYNELPDRWKGLWDKKSKTLAKEDEIPSDLYERAGIYAEFGKIVCISVGILTQKGDRWGYRIKSFYGHDEKKVLMEFCELLNTGFSSPQKLLCAHNGKEFDFPYLARRILIHRLKLPYLLDTAGKKPWEVNHIDTMQLWKFGDFKSFTSLDLLAAVFDIPTPKDDIDGSMVREVYYKDKDLERIKVYCEKDIITLANVLLRMTSNAILQDKDIVLTSQ